MIDIDIDPVSEIDSNTDFETSNPTPHSVAEDKSETEEHEATSFCKDDVAIEEPTNELENDPGESNCCDRYGHH